MHGMERITRGYKFRALPGIEPRFFGPVGHSLVTIPTELHRLPVRGRNEGKDRRRTGYEYPVEEQMCSSTLSFISALDGVDWLTPRPRRFTPG